MFRVYIADAKNGIFEFFFALAISKKVIISDISGRTLGKSLSACLFVQTNKKCWRYWREFKICRVFEILQIRRNVP